MNKFKWLLIKYMLENTFRSRRDFCCRIKDPPRDLTEIVGNLRRTAQNVAKDPAEMLRAKSAGRNLIVGSADRNTCAHCFFRFGFGFCAVLPQIKTAGIFENFALGWHFKVKNEHLLKGTRNEHQLNWDKDHSATCLRAGIGREALGSLDQGTSDSGYRTCTGNLDTRGQGLVSQSFVRMNTSQKKSGSSFSVT